MEQIQQPQIETSRLLLRPFCEGDLGDIFSYASDEEVTRYLLWDTHKTIDDSRKFYEWVKSSTNNIRGQLFFVFAIAHREHGKVIGSIDFKNPNKYVGQIDYALKKEFWNQGIMSEAACGVRDWSLTNFSEIVRIQSYCQPENIGSRRVMEKLGMEYEGLRRKSFIVRDKPVDLVHYALVR